MIGAFSAFGVDSSLAVATVLGYRTFEYWLPAAPHGAGPRRRRDHAKHVMTAHMLVRQN